MTCSKQVSRFKFSHPWVVTAKDFVWQIYLLLFASLSLEWTKSICNLLCCIMVYSLSIVSTVCDRLCPKQFLQWGNKVDLIYQNPGAWSNQSNVEMTHFVLWYMAFIVIRCSALLWHQQEPTLCINGTRETYIQKQSFLQSGIKVLKFKISKSSLDSRSLTWEQWPSGKQHHWCIIYQRAFVLHRKHHCDVWTIKTAGRHQPQALCKDIWLQWRELALNSLHWQKKGCYVNKANSITTLQPLGWWHFPFTNTSETIWDGHLVQEHFQQVDMKSIGCD